MEMWSSGLMNAYSKSTVQSCPGFSFGGGMSGSLQVHAHGPPLTAPKVCALHNHRPRATLELPSTLFSPMTTVARENLTVSYAILR